MLLCSYDLRSLKDAGNLTHGHLGFNGNYQPAGEKPDDKLLGTVPNAVFRAQRKPLSLSAVSSVLYTYT